MTRPIEEVQLMDHPSEHRGRSAPQIGLGLIMGIALGIVFGTAFDDWLFGMVIGIVSGVIIYGGLNLKRSR
jgi:hypothetical protein